MSRATVLWKYNGCHKVMLNFSVRVQLAENLALMLRKQRIIIDLVELGPEKLRLLMMDVE